jgi:hypothetical protein
MKIPRMRPRYRATSVPSVSCTQKAWRRRRSHLRRESALRCACEPWSLALEQEEERKRERNAGDAQGHGGHKCNDDGESVAEAAREASWKGRQLCLESAESADVLERVVAMRSSLTDK